MRCTCKIIWDAWDQTHQNKSFLIKKTFFMITSIGYLLVASRFNCTLETFETIYVSFNNCDVHHDHNAIVSFYTYK